MRAMVALHILQCSLASRGVEVEVAAEGVGVTLIDFTLSRLVTPDGATAFCDLEADPELFAGPKGDCQARRAPPPWWPRLFPRLPALHAAGMLRTCCAIPAASGMCRELLRACARADA